MPNASPPSLLRRGLLALAAGALAAPALAAYPDRPIRLVVGYAAGGGTDLTARAVATRMSAELGQQIVVENRGGGGGVPAISSVLQAPADGYSVMFSTAAVLVARALGTPMAFDPLEVLVPVGLVGVSPNVLVVHPSVPARNLQELQAYGRTRREPLRFGSPSISYTSHFVGQELGIEVEEVRYRGTGPLMTDLLAGRLDAYLIPLPGIQAAVRSGELRAIAVSYKTPLAPIPEVPTTAAQGFPNLISFTWTGLELRAGTPPEIVARLGAALNAALADPELRRKLGESGVEATERTDPDSFRALVLEEKARGEAVIRRFNLRE
ncbi:MFS transporter [Siccirubricoccus deserti]|uniref:Tripartite tricarboxylate transporter substrate binding protein n=1 Tax=Siccirubricoccus deserti TaxID=2013562 RepID=A0A9X0UFR3_9PROT|nr:tripartite tricarboxylate transporter substrate binding protein [Siccirubricoccus deserti]MBC4018163.1 tripartite tricarboxylate transporter substrate binding protein [Siccirubricoccus deserti]GGC63334.1 MFS transporter [Siccirubricoccus deserti]